MLNRSTTAKSNKNDSIPLFMWLFFYFSSEPYWFFDKNIKNRLYIARLVKNPAITSPLVPTEKIGMVAIGFEVPQLKNNINSSRLTNSEIIILTDRDGNILYGSNEEFVQKPIESSYPGLSKSIKKNNEIQYITYAGVRYIVCANSLKWGWSFVAMIPADEMSNRVNIIIRVMIFSILLAILIGILISIFVSTRISQPIKRLAKTMKGIKNKNNIGISLIPPSHDEVGTLYESFNEMMARIDSLVDEVYKSTLQQKVSELKALQAQINPHFLYNTLDSVCWLALRDGNDKIVDMLSSLASMMRYSIKNADSTVELFEEIENIKHFINIKTLSYSNSFEVFYDIDPKLDKYKIPKFVIQPLVENSFIHGISKNNNNGEIYISVNFEGELVRIEVKDNGVCDGIAILNEYLGGSKTALQDSDGFGIKNVNDRIKMYFGDHYGLKYEKDHEGRTVASITLPGFE